VTNSLHLTCEQEEAREHFGLTPKPSPPASSGNWPESLFLKLREVLLSGKGRMARRDEGDCFARQRTTLLRGN